MIYEVAVQAGCHPVLTPVFTNSTLMAPETILWINWESARLLGCNWYSDLTSTIIATLEPVLRQEATNLTKLVVFSSMADHNIGTLIEPYGTPALYNSSTVYFVSVSIYTGQLLAALPPPASFSPAGYQVCVTSEIGQWPIFYASGGWVARVVIFSLWFIILLATSAYQIVQGVLTSNRIRVLVFSHSSVYLLCEFPSLGRTSTLQLISPPLSLSLSFSSPSS